MNILIAGDLAPTQSNVNAFIEGHTKSLLGEDMFSIWNAADMRVFNLEVPLTDQENPINKCGPNLITPTSTVNGIKALNPSLIALANNHILDQGVHGLKSTIDILNENRIPFVGAGESLSQASKPYVIEHEGLKIAVYNCAEHEFSIATREKPGANPFDPLESLDHILEQKSKCDYVIVLYHGGKEHYRYPSPSLQKVCRKMVEKGADLVVCQHSHCVGAYEEYKEATIVYGQGNFIFNELDNEYWNSSVLIDVKIQDKLSVNYIPIVMTQKGIRLAKDRDKENILGSFKRRSEEILVEGFIEKEYEAFAKKNSDFYLRRFLGFGNWIIRIDRRIFRGYLLKRKTEQSYLLAVQNYIECESHRELLLMGLVQDRKDEKGR